MIISKNPFYFKVLPLDYPFCNRIKELSDLVSYAKGKANVLVYSPRRYGKTSLIKRVQNELAKKGAITIFADFFGVSSVDDVASRLARSVYEVTRTKEGLFSSAIKFLKTFRPVLKPDESGSVSLTVEPSSSKTSGMELLEETMSSIGEFISKTNSLFNIALDEFQEIVELKDAPKIEGILRTHIQKHEASYFFIGSRRHILLGIFNDKQRPFFQSAINYKIEALPHDELLSFIVDMFAKGGKSCPRSSAGSIAKLVHEHPYYSQKLAFFIYETAGKEIAEDNVREGFSDLLGSEQPVFEAILQGLAPQQIALLKAIAEEQAAAIFSVNYMKNHRLGSTGGVQGAIKRLLALDLVEKNDSSVWRVVDPIFADYLREK